MAEKTDPFKDLESLLGFNPSKGETATGDALRNAMKKIEDERLKKAEEHAEGLLRQALALHQEFTKVDQAYQKQKQNFAEKLGKLVKTLKRTLELKGEPEPESEPEVEEPVKAPAE